MTLKEVENEFAAREKPDKFDRYDAILDAAEFVFAQSDFNGASIREIADRAGVAQALVHYHFKTKEQLFIKMCDRWGDRLTVATTELVKQRFKPGQLPTLEQMIEVLLRPMLERGLEHAESGSSFASIVVSVVNSQLPRDLEIIERIYDPMTLRFMEKLSEVEPGISKKNAVWSYLFAIGIGMTMMAQTGRSIRLSGGTADDRDIDDMLEDIITFTCAGVRALVKSQKQPKMSEPKKTTINH